jgi:hypothetical protein
MNKKYRTSGGGIVTALALLVACGCGKNEGQKGVDPDIEEAGTLPPLKNVTLPRVTFTDITQKAGIRFRHVNGSFGKKLLPETMGAGVAFLDYDNDGHQDLLFINSCYWPGHEQKGPEPTPALYRNKGDGTFEDVTEKAGLKVTFYGMGVACGDYNNDGWADVFITGVGGNHLFRNDKGVFHEATASMKVEGPGGWDTAAKDFLKYDQPLTFSTSATFLDYDGDGKLDLFVCNYVSWSPAYDLSKKFTLNRSTRAFGPPREFEGVTCLLYRNAGDHFEDVSAEAGIQVFDTEGVPGRKRGAGKSLGVIVCDPDEDGWPDIVVANDTVRNFFFHNVPDKNGGRAFEEQGLRSGVAYPASQSRARGAMGIDWGEYRPGKHALFIANFADEPASFLRLDSPKSQFFQDVAAAEGLAGPTRTPLKFGAFYFDFDLDGRLDILTCNGHLEPDIALVQQNQTFPQSAQLFWNTGVAERCFERVGAKQCGPDLFRPMVGRSCAYADIDGNGTPDVVLTANGGPARLLRNEGGTGHHWVRLKLEGDGVRSNRSAIGARVEIKVGNVVMQREVLGARGYLSQSELPITVGLGKATKVDRVTVHWPGKNAGTTVYENLAVDRTHDLRQKK